MREADQYRLVSTKFLGPGCLLQELPRFCSLLTRLCSFYGNRKVPRNLSLKKSILLPVLVAHGPAKVNKNDRWKRVTFSES